MKLPKIMAALFLLASVLIANNATATATTKLNVKVKLSKIIAEEISEERGDELYFSITKYSNEKDADQHLVPMFPTYWLSKNLNKVKNVTLWKDEIMNKEEVKLIVSLIEKDAPPWSLDDSVGSVQLMLKNNNGKLEYSWQKPDFKKVPNIEIIRSDKNAELVFKGQGRYKINLKIEDSKVLVKDKEYKVIKANKIPR